MEPTISYRHSKETLARLAGVRKTLVLTAVELVSEGGFRKLTMAGLASRAKVATGTLYKHFENKHALCVEVFVRVASLEIDNLHEVIRSRGLQAGLRSWCERAQGNRILARALLTEPAGESIHHARLEFRAAFAKVIQDHIDIMIFQQSLPEQNSLISSRCIVGALSASVPKDALETEAIVASCLASLHPRS